MAITTRSSIRVKALAVSEDEVEGCMAKGAGVHGQTTLLPGSSSNQLAQLLNGDAMFEDHLQIFLLTVFFRVVS